jgi:hypothetical protein
MNSCKASELKPGQRIVLDMGYGAHSMDETCTITTVQQTLSLFKDPVVRLQVRRPGGELIHVNDFRPDEKIGVMP